MFVGATPRVQNIAATSFELVVEMSKAGLVFYMVLLQVRCCVDAAVSAASLAGGPDEQGWLMCASLLLLLRCQQQWLLLDIRCSRTVLSWGRPSEYPGRVSQCAA